jgi:hypothetical protein
LVVMGATSAIHDAVHGCHSSVPKSMARATPAPLIHFQAVRGMTESIGCLVALPESEASSNAKARSEVD